MPPATSARLLGEPAPGLAAWTIDFEDASRMVLNGATLELDALAGGQTLRASAEGGPLRVAGGDDWLLGDNGRWRASRGFLGASGMTDPLAGQYARLVIDFGGAAVSALGAWVNQDTGVEYAPGKPVPMLAVAYDLNGERLEAHELLPRTPGAVDAAVFVGFARERADIARVEFSGPAVVLDDLQFAQPVPEPASLLLAIVAIGVFVVARVGAGRRGGDPG